MFAGMVLVSAAVGTVATATMVVFSAPTVIALVTYAVVCGLTLVLTASLCSIRASNLSRNAQLLRPML